MQCCQRRKIGCFEKAISYFSEAATMFEFKTKSEKNQNVIVHIHIDA